jgi:hypothetical protein
MYLMEHLESQDRLGCLIILDVTTPESFPSRMREEHGVMF